MNHLYRQSFRLIIAVLSVCLANTFVLAGAPKGSSNVLGVLKASNAQSVFVNGNRAEDGMTILSGNLIETKGTNATVQMRGLGEVHLVCNTSLRLTFAADNINVDLTNGTARLTANQGVSGTINPTNAKMVQTDSSLLNSTIEASANDSSTERRGSRCVVAAAPRFSGGFLAFNKLGAYLFSAGVTTAVIAVLTNPGDDTDISVARP